MAKNFINPSNSRSVDFSEALKISGVVGKINYEDIPAKSEHERRVQNTIGPVIQGN